MSGAASSRLAGLRRTMSAGLSGALPEGLADRLSDTSQTVGLRAGFAAVRALPAPVAYRLFDSIADLSARRGGKGVDRLRANYAKVRPELDAPALDALVRAGMRSYMRYYCDAFRLAGSTPQQLGQAVRGVGDQEVRDVLARGKGAVVFLGHLANWDSGGAWSSTHIAPVTTVAERLKPEAVFLDFLEFRQSLGMTIIPLTGGGDPFVALKQAIGRGEFVALLADRDLTHTGVEVDLCGHRARMAKGPAVLSVMTGAPLFVASLWYEPAPAQPNGHRVVVDLRPVPTPESGTTRDKVQAMVQRCADILGDTITRHTEDWHMLQRIFVDDLTDPPPVPASRAAEVAS